MLSHARIAMLLAVLMLGAAACSPSPEAGDATPEASATQGAAPTQEAAMPDAAGPDAVELGPDAVTTDSGLRYEDLVTGEGQEATRCSVATVHYDGRLVDGTPFDSSRQRGEPFAFVVGGQRVIKGWDEGVAGMRVGGTRRLVVPPDLGYGAAGQGSIPPNATLVFDVELLDASGDVPAVAEAPADVEGYETTESGLQVAVLEEGEGPAAESGRQVMVHYTGWLEDGTMFDSSLGPDRCGPLQFPLGAGQVIRGWDEGVQGMQVGERRQLRIPPELAYGASGSGPIPPNAVLVFDVELVAVQ